MLLLYFIVSACFIVIFKIYFIVVMDFIGICFKQPWDQTV